MIRLQKILSTAGVASRRASEQMILEGRVMVNGETVLELGTKADPDKDAIKVDGRRIKTDITHRYIVLYKPKGYVTTRSDPEGRRTVMDLIGEGAYIYPVGRSGLRLRGPALDDDRRRPGCEVDASAP